MSDNKNDNNAVVDNHQQEQQQEEDEEEIMMMKELIAKDPELRQLIEESSWQQIVDGASITEQDGVGNALDSVLESMPEEEHRVVEHHEHERNMNNSNSNSPKNENSNNSARVEAAISYLQDSSLGIRKSENGKFIMHIDPTGTFFGGNNSDTATSSLVVDDNNDEPFDYEMTEEDLQFYQELRQLVKFREEMLEKLESDREENLKQEKHEEENEKEKKILSATAVAEFSDGDSSSDNGEKDGDVSNVEDKEEKEEAEDSEFLQQIRKRNEILYKKFCEKSPQQDQVAITTTSKQQNNKTSSSKGFSLFGKRKKQENSSSSLTTTTTQKNNNKNQTPPEIAQLLREIGEEYQMKKKQRQQQEQREEDNSEKEQEDRKLDYEALLKNNKQQRKEEKHTAEQIESEIIRNAELACNDMEKFKKSENQQLHQEKQEEEETQEENKQKEEKAEKKQQEFKELQQELLQLDEEYFESKITLSVADISSSEKQKDKNETAAVSTSNNNGNDDDGEEEIDSTNNNNNNKKSEEIKETSSALEKLAEVVLPTKPSSVSEDLKRMQQYFSESNERQRNILSNLRKEINERHLEKQIAIAATIEQEQQNENEKLFNSPLSHKNSNNNTNSRNNKISSSLVQRLILSDVSEDISTTTSFDSKNDVQQPIIIENVALFPSSSAAAAASASSVDTKKKKKNANEKSRKKAQQKLFQERREAQERSIMSEIDSQLHRQVWISERTALDNSSARDEIILAEQQTRLATRSEESTRIHDLRVRETRQRAILNEWISHKLQQSHSEQRRSIEKESEPELRLKLRDVESCGWVEIMSAFTEQRDLLLGEEKSKQEQQEREEKLKKERERAKLMHLWNELKIDSAQSLKQNQIVLSSTSSSQQQSYNNNNNNNNFNDMSSLLSREEIMTRLVSALRNTISSFQNKKSKLMLSRNSSFAIQSSAATENTNNNNNNNNNNSRPQSASSISSSRRNSTSATTTNNTELLFSKSKVFLETISKEENNNLKITSRTLKNHKSAQNNNKHRFLTSSSSYLPSSSTTSIQLLTLLPIDVTARCMSEIILTNDTNNNSESSSLDLGNAFSSFCELFLDNNNFSNNFTLNQFKLGEKEAAEEEELLRDTANFLHNCTNILNVSPTTNCSKIPSISELEIAMPSLVALDFHGNKSLKEISSSTSTSSSSSSFLKNKIKPVVKMIKRRRGNLRYLNLNDCNLTSISNLFVGVDDNADDESHFSSSLNIFLCSNNKLSGSLSENFLSSFSSKPKKFFDLVVLDLSGNCLEDFNLSEEISSSLVSLQYLDISSNNSNTIHTTTNNNSNATEEELPRWITQNNTLRVLKASNYSKNLKRISNVEIIWPFMEIVDLSQNNLQMLVPHHKNFSSSAATTQNNNNNITLASGSSTTATPFFAPFLKTLNLRQNELSNVDSLCYCLSLEKVDLSDNSLSLVGTLDAAFVGVGVVGHRRHHHSLKELNLRKNSLLTGVKSWFERNFSVMRENNNNHINYCELVVKTDRDGELKSSGSFENNNNNNSMMMEKENMNMTYSVKPLGEEPLLDFVSESLRMLNNSKHQKYLMFNDDKKKSSSEIDSSSSSKRLLAAIYQRFSMNDLVDQLYRGLQQYSSSTSSSNSSSSASSSSSSMNSSIALSSFFSRNNTNTNHINMNNKKDKNQNMMMVNSKESFSSSSNFCENWQTFIKINSAAMKITCWWKRIIMFRILAERAQRKIAPVWRGAWTRLRLKRMKSHLDDDLFDIPTEGVQFDESELGPAPPTSMVEVLRKRANEISNNNNTVTSSASTTKNVEKTRSNVVVTPHPPKTQKNRSSSSASNTSNLFVIRNEPPTIDSNNNNKSNTSVLGFGRPSAPIPTSSSSSSNIANTPPVVIQRSSSASISAAASHQQQHYNNNNNNNNSSDKPQRQHSAQPHGSSATQQQQQGEQQQQHGEEGEGAGWSSAITDLLKYRDRKRASAQTARQRQEWLKRGGKK